MILLAKLFARIAHKGHKRKYTGEPYYNHLAEVAHLVQAVPHTKEMVMAAYLHDTVEDTWVESWMIEFLFGEKVCEHVAWLTDVSDPDDGNRALRKAIDRAHSAASDPESQTIKLCDLISNSQSIMEHDMKFAKVYMREKELLLGVLTAGNILLRDVALDILREYKETHGTSA